MTEEIIDHDEEIALGAKNSGINILTILTIIGCVLLLIFTIYGSSQLDNNYDRLVDLQEGGSTGSAFTDNMMLNNAESITASYENKIPLLATGILGGILCLLGAILMRKGQLRGFYFWLAGEWIPLLISVIIIGFGAISGWQMFNLVIPVVFTILYFAHKKYLV